MFSGMPLWWIKVNTDSATNKAPRLAAEEFPALLDVFAMAAFARPLGAFFAFEAELWEIITAMAYA